mgnify:CR=1 FL=1
MAEATIAAGIIKTEDSPAGTAERLAKGHQRRAAGLRGVDHLGGNAGACRERDSIRSHRRSPSRIVGYSEDPSHQGDAEPQDGRRHG